MKTIHKNGTTLLNRVVGAIQNFETYKLNSLLDKTKTYQDVTLSDFSELVESRLQSFKDAGDTELLLSSDICNGCHCKEPIFVFTGNVSKKKYALYFEFKGEQITDIFECSWYGEMTFLESF